MIESKGDPVNTKELMHTNRSLQEIKKRIGLYKCASAKRKVAIPLQKLTDPDDEDFK